MRLLVLSRYEDLAPSSRVRTYQYLPYLRSEGIDVTVAPLFSNDYIRNLYEKRTRKLTAVIISYFKRLFNLLRIKRYDLLWIEKELFPMLPAWFEEVISKLRVPYIVDFDDAVFHNYDLNKNILVRKLLSYKIDKVMKEATVVIVGNDYLARRAVKAGAKRVEYLPSVIDLKKYKFTDKFNTDIFRVGWIGSPLTVKYLKLVLDALKEFCSCTNSEVVLIGSGEVNLPDINLKVIEWREDDEVKNIQSLDVGIMPLLDGLWERGKCGYKLIQYMACGRPVIASPVGANKKIVMNGINGFIARCKNEWINALKELYINYDLRKKMGLSGRLLVEKDYCVQVTAPKLIKIIKTIVF